MASECQKFPFPKTLFLKMFQRKDAPDPPTGTAFGGPYLEPPSLKSAICPSIIALYVCITLGGAVDSSGLGLSPGQVHCMVFLGNTLFSHGAFLSPGE